MIRKFILSYIIFLISSIAYANDLTITNAIVTKVQVYETPKNTTEVWIHLNGNSRVGPNPINSAHTCELWTYDKTVHATALSALLSGKEGIRSLSRPGKRHLLV